MSSDLAEKDFNNNRKQKTGPRHLWLQLKIACQIQNLGTFGNVPKIAIFDDWGGAKMLVDAQV